MIEASFFEQDGDVPDPRELDLTDKNLIFDDLMLSKQNKCEEYYVRGRHNIVDCFYLCQRYFKLQTIRENANFICLFRQDDRNLDHIHRDFCTDLSLDQFKALCRRCWSEPHGFGTIDLTSPREAGRYQSKLDEFFVVPEKL